MEVVSEVLKTYISLFLNDLKARRYPARYFSVMSQVLNPNTSFHQKNYQLNSQELILIQDWRNEIKIGDRIDVLTQYKEYTELRAWLPATVEGI